MEEIQKKRLQEMKIVGTMLEIYCHGHHGTKGHELCDECQELLNYAKKRVQFCPRMEEKTFCSVCETHCYAPARRLKIKEVMRYSGPRMIFHSPLAVLRHMYIEWCHKSQMDSMI